MMREELQVMHNEVWMNLHETSSNHLSILPYFVYVSRAPVSFTCMVLILVMSSLISKIKYIINTKTSHKVNSLLPFI
jgi:hypothetical protein